MIFKTPFFTYLFDFIEQLILKDDPLGSAVVPVCLPWKASEPTIENLKKFSKLTVTGWGRVTNNNYKSKKAYLELSVATKTLRKVELPLVIPASEVYNYCRTSNDTTQFCAGGVKGNLGAIFISIRNRTKFKITSSSI